MGHTIELGSAFSLDDLLLLAEGRADLSFGAGARGRVGRARAFVDSLRTAGDDAPNVYGVNTGFGALAETRIQASEMRALQKNLVRSHSAGVGPPLDARAVRAMIALRAQTLALGHSGVRESLIDALVALFRSGVVPRIPAQGSVGASGDLAPLAHLALVLIGEGEADIGAERMSGAEALARAGLAPVELEAKEGISLINGTQMMLAVGGLAIVDADRLATTADLVGAMSLEALQGTGRPFDARVQAVRPHPGQAVSAANLRTLLADSEIMESHRDCGKVQDPYSLRCMPQVHGATRDVLAFARAVLEREIASATDNPLVFVEDDGPEDEEGTPQAGALHPGGVGEGAGGPRKIIRAEVISGGNFHGQPVALALDAAAMAVAELANVSERRLEQLVNPAMSSGLPPFLAPRTGLDSGFMMAQVTAAALVSENKVLCHPSSVDSIPSSAGKEDHVSMGSISSRKLAEIVTNVRRVLAIEALVAAQGIDLRAPLRPAKGVAAAQARLRQRVATLVEDRPLYLDIEAVEELVRSGVLIDAAEAAVGPLR